MKKIKIIYWASNILSVVPAIASGIAYLTHPFFLEAFKHFGFPDYFRIQLGIAKIIGGLIILIPSVSSRVKEWAYVGLAITFISAIIAHYSVDGFSQSVAPLIVLILLVISYIQFYKLENLKSKQLI